MVLRTPQMLKKSGINSVCAENRRLQGHVKQSEGKKSLHFLWSVEGIPNAPYPSSIDSPKPQNIFSYFKLIQVSFLFNFRNLIYRIFLGIIITIRCSGMFQDVPECSGMFRYFPSSCFACFGRFFAVVSFQPFHFVVSGVSTCRRICHSRKSSN